MELTLEQAQLILEMAEVVNGEGLLSQAQGKLCVELMDHFGTEIHEIQGRRWLIDRKSAEEANFNAEG